MEDEKKVNSLIPKPDETRERRMKWWKDARLGMFIHAGPYSVLGRGEWAMQQELIPAEEYTKYGEQWCPKTSFLYDLVKLAKEAGMKYVILTTKHCDGYHLWDSQNSDFTAAKMGPKRDLVREFVEACRSLDMRIGLYYGLMDWRHPDGDLCAIDEAARKRFVAYTRNNLKELMSNYGKIDILWFDGPWPMPTAEQWESEQLIDLVRSLQPDIIVNNRARCAEDFSCPEGEVAEQPAERYWEACMTLNGDWGWAEHPPGDWESLRDVLRMIRKATAYNGNLLLNVGPMPDGSIPDEARSLLISLGKWLQLNAEAVYGAVDRIDGTLEAWVNTGFWTRKGNTAYFWLLRGWTGPAFAIGGVETPVESIELLADGRRLAFVQTDRRLLISGLPDQNPDPVAGCPVLKIIFCETPKQVLSGGMILLPEEQASWW